MTPYRTNPAEKALSPDEALARAILSSRLLAGETLIWAGRPRHGLRLELQGTRVTAFVILFTAGGLLAVIADLAAGRAPSAGSVLIAVALLVLLFPLVADARSRARTFYGISNQRLLILSPSRELTQYWLAHLPQTSLLERSGGFGDIYVNSPTYIGQRRRPQYNSPEMVHVAKAAEVHGLLRDAMADAANR